MILVKYKANKIINKMYVYQELSLQLRACVIKLSLLKLQKFYYANIDA